MEQSLERALDIAESVIESAQQRPPKRKDSSSGEMSLHEKLYDIYVEESEKEPEVAEELRSNVNLLEKLLRRESLPCLVVNLYPGKQGYSLMLKGENGSFTESIQLPYEEGELLKYLDAQELPPVLVDLLEKLPVNVFHQGCVIAEIRDYRQSSEGEPPSYQSRHILLRPTMQTLACDVEAIASDNQNWTQEDKLLLESQLILATAEPPCLDPSVSVACTENRLLYNEQKLNTVPMKRSLKRFSTASLNQQQDLSPCPLPPELTAETSFTKEQESKQDKQSDPKTLKADKCVDTWRERLCDLAAPYEVDVEKYMSFKYDDWPTYEEGEDSIFGYEDSSHSQAPEQMLIDSLNDPFISGRSCHKKNREVRHEIQMSPYHSFTDDHSSSFLFEPDTDDVRVVSPCEESSQNSAQCAVLMSHSFGDLADLWPPSPGKELEQPKTGLVQSSGDSADLRQPPPGKEPEQPKNGSVQSSVLGKGAKHTPSPIRPPWSPGKSSWGDSFTSQQVSSSHQFPSPASAPKLPSLSQKSSMEVSQVSSLPAMALSTVGSSQRTEASATSSGLNITKEVHPGGGGQALGSGSKPVQDSTTVPAGIKPGPLPAGIKLSLLPTGINLGSLPIGLMPRPLPIGIKLEPLPTGIKSRILPTGINLGPLPTGMKPDHQPTGFKPGPLLTGIKPGTLPTGMKFDYQTTGIKSGLQPIRIKPGCQPRRTRPGPLPTGIRLEPLPTGMKLDHQPTEIKPGPQPIGMKPESLPTGMKPDYQTTGIKPGSQPIGIKPGTLPTGMKLDQQPTGIRPGPQPIGIRPGPQPIGIRPGPQPIGIRPGPQPIGIRPGPQPIGIKPGPLPTGIRLEPLPTGMKLDHQPTEIKPGPQPTGMKPEPLPTGMKLDYQTTGIKPGAQPIGIKPGPLPTGIKPGTLPTGMKLDHQPTGIRPGLQPTGIKPGPLPTGIMPGTLPTGMKLDQQPIGIRPGPQPIGIKPGTQPIEIKPGTQPIEIKRDPQLREIKLHPLPTGTKPSPLPTEIKPGPLPTGIKPRLLPREIKPKLLPTGIKPVLLSTGIQPDPLPAGIKPFTQLTGIQPDTLPTGIQPDSQPTGIQPDTLPTGIQPASQPTGIQPASQPTGIISGLLPTGIKPDTLPTGIKLDTQPTGIQPGPLPAGAQPPNVQTTALPVSSQGGVQLVNNTPILMPFTLFQLPPGTLILNTQQQAQEQLQQPMQQWLYQLIPQPQLQQPTTSHPPQSVPQDPVGGSVSQMALSAQQPMVINLNAVESFLQPRAVVLSQVGSVQSGPWPSLPQHRVQLAPTLQLHPQPQPVQFRILQHPVAVATVVTPAAQPQPPGEQAASQPKGKKESTPIPPKS